MSDPTISVLMAAYNGAALLPETLESLRRQTFGDFEVIVVDDCSSDATRDLVRNWPDLRVRLIELAQNGGPVRARNRAFAEARGRYVAGLDQDDLCHPDRFAQQVVYLDAHADTVLVGSATEVLQDGFTLPSPHVAHTTPALLRWLIRIENPLVWSSVMVRTNAARQLDPFTRPDILYAEDFDLYHRLSRHGTIARLDAPLLTYRRHAGGASQRYETVMLGNAKRVLAENYATIFGEEADDAAALIVEHLMHRQPVPDRAALACVGRVLRRLQKAFLAESALNEGDLRLVRWTTARRWANVSRASLRAGTIGMRDALAVRPSHLGLGHAGIEELLWARLIGRARRVTQRYTLAA